MKKYVIPLLILTVILMASCTYPTYSPFGFWFGSTSSTPKKGAYLFLNFDTHLQESNLLDQIDHYTLIIEGSKENIQENQIPKDTSELKYYLPTGDYKVKIIAHASNGQSVGIFEQQINIKKGEREDVTIVFSETSRLVLELPFAPHSNGITSREINTETNAWSVFIRDVTNANTGEEFDGTTYVFKKYITNSDNTASEKVAISLTGAKDYSIELYSHKSDYNPTNGNSNFDNSTTTFDYGSTITHLNSGETKEVRIQMNAFDATAVQATVDITSEEVQPLVNVTFPADYVDNRLRNTGNLSGFNALDFTLQEWKYATDTTATQGSFSSSYLDKTTNSATIIAQSLNVGTFSSTGTVYYWFEVTDVNGIKLIFPNERYASFERTNGTSISIIPE